MRTGPVGVPTFRLAVPETDPEVEVIVTFPAARAVTNPVALTVATLAFEETQVLELVRSVNE